MELDDAIHRQIQGLCAQGDESAAAGRFDEAVARYRNALHLVPEPRHAWAAATWIFAAIGDAFFLAGDRPAALGAFRDAMACPDAVGNPFLHLRLGELSFDAGDLDRAADELMRAYMGAGAEIFAAEDPRYLTFLKTRAVL